MNAIEDNPFTRKLSELGRTIPQPKAILCVSAHWLTAGTWVTHMAAPRTIHDFYGFPQELFEIRYPAPGSPETAELVQSIVAHPKIILDDETWGFDHGTWSILRHMYPQARIPVLQLGINLSKPPLFHYELGKSLRALRDRAVLIVGSGNIVHNLRKIRWEENAEPFDWAIEFDEWVKQRLLRREINPLLDDITKTTAGKLSVPSPDHYYPLLYALGAGDESDSLRFEFEGIQNGSISMRCLSFGFT